MSNPVGYFEIPVINLERAVSFYSYVFDIELEIGGIDGYDMAFFPMIDDAPGISGALAKGDVYVPSKTGTIIYFDVDDIDIVLSKVNEKGGNTLYPKTSIGEYGHVAEFEDSEGNRIALHQKR